MKNPYYFDFADYTEGQVVLALANEVCDYGLSREDLDEPDFYDSFIEDYIEQVPENEEGGLRNHN
ncbi:MAG: hypothetical protein ACFE9L_12360 [Candidatus Hodarchaeota archaeon]